MHEIDYKKIGLKCGIEIHQRIDSHKLFCSCPSTLREDKPDIVVRREIRAVAGETGEIDIAAEHEMGKKEYFIYEGYSDTTCLVELDCEPPHPMNTDALKVVLQVCKMTDSNIVDEIRVMRKTVVNGSNTSGFQRTALVALNGKIDVEGLRVGIPTILIEEEACKDIEKGVDKDGKRFVRYGLDRLGIPLIEIGTDPDIKTPEQCKAVAERIGMILRSTGKVARGLGTIRQDVNISIREGRRIEIKGAQDLKMLPTLVENEAKRQLALIELKKELEKRGNKLSRFSSADVSSVLKNTECSFVSKAISKGETAFAFTIPGFSGLLGKETQPGKRVGTELSEYAKVKTGIGGIIHSDEDLKKYNFRPEEIEKIKKLLSCKEEDAFAVIVAESETAKSATIFVIERASACFDGVPGEVRKANPDGTTSYQRPLPGAARMYPETDIPPIKPDLSGIEIPELLTEKKERFIEEHGLGADLAQALSKSGKHDLFEAVCEKFKNVKPAFIAEILISVPKNLKRNYNVEIRGLTDAVFEKIFSLLDSGKLTKDAVETILLAVCRGEKVDYSKYAPLDDALLKKEIEKIVAENKGDEFKVLIGKVMEQLKGRAEGKKIIDVLKNVIK
jgi:glutamyl-tRNA(Gln) amidotransferase subunit E